MAVYILYGFQWHRAAGPKAPGIRIYIILNNVLEAAAEYLQQPDSNRAIINSFKNIEPDISTHLPDLQLIERYDPEDTSSAAVSQPYAFVAGRVLELSENSHQSSKPELSLSMKEMAEKDGGLPPGGEESLKKLRDNLNPDGEIGWWIVYNGDPERDFPESEDEGSYQEDDQSVEGEGVDVAEKKNNESLEKSPVCLKKSKPISCSACIAYTN